jgi:hypothetical protein
MKRLQRLVGMINNSYNTSTANIVTATTVRHARNAHGQIVGCLTVSRF